jgi:hypothetical protein
LLFEGSPDNPQAATTPDGFVEFSDDGLHLTHAETVKGEEPVGIDDFIDAEKNDPLERTIAVLGKEVEFV